VAAGPSYRRNVKRLPDGRYVVRKVIWGRAYQRTFSTERGAGVYLESLELKAAGVAAEDAPRTLHGVVQAYLDRLKDRGRTTTTWDYYHRIGVTLLEHLGDGADPRLTQRQVDTFTQERMGNTGGIRLLKELKALRSMVTSAGYTLEWRLPDLRVVHHFRELPPDEDVARLYLSLADQPDAQRGYLLALLTGMRASEVLATRWSQVDLKERRLLVRVEKTGTQNWTAIVDTLAAALKPVGRPEELVVPVHLQALRSMLERRSRTLGLSARWYGYGLLRHVAATWSHEAGYTVEQVGLLLAHRRPGVTQAHYIHAVSVKLKGKMLRAVEKRFLSALRKVKHQQKRGGPGRT
jgi:integrase